MVPWELYLLTPCLVQAPPHGLWVWPWNWPWPVSHEPACCKGDTLGPSLWNTHFQSPEPPHRGLVILLESPGQLPAVSAVQLRHQKPERSPLNGLVSLSLRRLGPSQLTHQWHTTVSDPSQCYREWMELFCWILPKFLAHKIMQNKTVAWATKFWGVVCHAAIDNCGVNGKLLPSVKLVLFLQNKTLSTNTATSIEFLHQITLKRVQLSRNHVLSQGHLCIKKNQEW